MKGVGAGLTPAQLQLLLQGQAPSQAPALHVRCEAELFQDGCQLLLLSPRGHRGMEPRDVDAAGHYAVQTPVHYHVGHCGDMLGKCGQRLAQGHKCAGPGQGYLVSRPAARTASAGGWWGRCGWR